MGQDVNLARKLAVQNVGCVFVYFCGGHKNNFPIWFRSSFKKFTKFTGKQMCRSLFFNEVSGLQLYQKRDWHRCFPVNFAKFHRTPFLQNTSGRLLPLYCFFIAITIFSLTTFSCPSVTFFNHDYLLIVTVLELWYC